MSELRKHKLQNSSGTVINPATEAKQDDIITAVEDKILKGNSAADGSGTDYYAIVDSAGRLQTRGFRLSDGTGARMLVDSDRHGQIDVLTTPEKLALYVAQALDDYTTASTSYVCKMKEDGTWLFIKIDETGNFPTFTYANVSNNATKTTYALAYTDRTTLTYGLLNTLTIT